MQISDKEKKILGILQEQKQVLSLPELLHLLGPDYRERSVRRWLSELVDLGLVEKTGKKRGTRYRALETEKKISNEFAQLKRDIPFVFRAQSQAALAFVHQPLFKRAPVTYHSAWLDDYQPNHTYYFSQEVREQLYQEGKRGVAEEPGGSYAQRIYERLLIDLSYNSSRLEGNTYSLLDTKRLVLEGIQAEDKLDEETVMILNHKEAIRYLMNHAKNKLSINADEIRTLHYLLADSLVETKYAGKLRDHSVRISGSTYIPLENKAVLEEKLNLICHKAAVIQNPYEQSLFLLVHIAYLQAFVDVNKRTARLSANIPLILNNVVPLSFNDISKEDYISAMIAIYELNDVGPLSELYIASYFRTCQSYNKTVESFGFDHVRVRYRQRRRDMLRYIITHQLTQTAMQTYIEEEIEKHIQKADQEKFLQDINDDLNEVISSHRIAGLGVTTEQLMAWLKKKE